MLSISCGCVPCRWINNSFNLDLFDGSLSSLFSSAKDEYSLGKWWNYLHDIWTRASPIYLHIKKKHTKNMIFGPAPPSFVFISPHISGVSPNMTCQTPQPLIKSSNTRFLLDQSSIIALPCHSVTHCQCLPGWSFWLGDGMGRVVGKSFCTGTGRVKFWLEDMEGDPGNPAEKLKSHRNAEEMVERV